MAAVLSVALPVSALSVETSGSGSASVGTKSGVDVNVSSETSVESNASASANSETEGSNDATFEVEAAGPTVIIAADLDGDTSANVSVKSSAEVNSKTTLNSYARSVVKANADIRDVSLSDSEVSVSHREKARIFGIFPVTVFARTSVASDGRVKVKFPWYCFATAKKMQLESNVKAAVQSSLPSVSANAEAQAKLSSQAQALVLEKTVATMKAQLEADAGASAKVN